MFFIKLKKIVVVYVVISFLGMGMITGCSTAMFQRPMAATGEMEMSDQTEYTLWGAGGGALGGAALGAGFGAIGGKAGLGAGIGALTGLVLGGLIGNYMGYNSDQLETELREKLLGSGIQVGQNADGAVYLIMANQITFNTNSTVVKADLGRAFNAIRLVLQMEDYKHLGLGVYGFTDSVGTDAYNHDLSVRRANAVARALQSAGVMNPIQAMGMGEIKEGNETRAGRAANRKVIIVFKNVGSERSSYENSIFYRDKLEKLS